MFLTLLSFVFTIPTHQIFTCSSTRCTLTTYHPLLLLLLLLLFMFNVNSFLIFCFPFSLMLFRSLAPWVSAIQAHLHSFYCWHTNTQTQQKWSTSLTHFFSSDFSEKRSNNLDTCNSTTVVTTAKLSFVAYNISVDYWSDKNSRWPYLPKLPYRLSFHGDSWWPCINWISYGS